MNRFEREGYWALAAAAATFLAAVVAFCLPLIDWRGPLVGWLLVVAGAGELFFGLVRRRDGMSRALLLSGLLTLAIGGMIVVGRTTDYLAVRNLIMAWLIARGLTMIGLGLVPDGGTVSRWLAFAGMVDLVLGFLLLFGMNTAVLLVLIFGPTPLIVAKFGLILAISFLATSVSQFMIALRLRKVGLPGPPDARG